MKKKIITKISEGLGNQLFMYANSYAISKVNNLDFYIDPFSGYYQKKHNYMFFLNNFNINSKIASDKFIFNSSYRNSVKKLLIFFDKFRFKKRFFFEKKNSIKETKFLPININNSYDHFFIDGNFESEKYFSNFRKELLSEFTIKNQNQFLDNKYLKMINNYNVISICIRQNRFSESIKNKRSKKAIDKSNFFVQQSVDYIYKSIIFFKNKIKNPIFLVWSNDFAGLDRFFDPNKFIFVKNNNNKVLTDFYLLTKCKYFIVGPSTFHWWGAWLSNFNDKIIVRPKNLSPSNNLDFWPESWVSI
tara:strand:+ start:775 stop:1683 length:909 start_codon:yes stop_codon:yes gene_type:complete